jgi:tRNA nucleotidyltransferase (CCA-adding enzyme)
VVTLVENLECNINPTLVDVKIWLNKLGQERFRQLLAIKKSMAKATSPLDESSMLSLCETESLIDVITEEKQCYDLGCLKVNGDDLIELGIPKGKFLGETLNELLFKVIRGEVENDRYKLIKLLKIIVDKEIDW